MQKTKRFFKIFFANVLIAVAIVFCVFVFSTNFGLLNLVLQAKTIYQSDIEKLTENGFLGKFFDVEIDKEMAKTDHANIKIKFLNLLKVKSTSVKIVPDQKVFLGGNIVVLSAKPQGLIVTKTTKVETENGQKWAFDKNSIKAGDLIFKIDDKAVLSKEDFVSAIENKDEVNVYLRRGGQEICVKANPKTNCQTKTKKLGLYVKDDFGCAGTLTFIDENGEFGAFGHSINHAGNIFKIADGKLFDANVLGINKGKNGKAGEILAIEKIGDCGQIGTFEQNTNFGVFGEVFEDCLSQNDKSLYDVCGRFNVKPGKAQILCQVDEGEAKFYDIKILKTKKQKNSATKGIVFKVVDKELLQKTGGIVQGMSGSPIVQNGKVVGAVTHVFLNDASKGYGIYLDFMLNEI